MIDTLRSQYPQDMARVAEQPGAGAIESIARDVMDQLKEYARENPTSFGLCALGIGFILGWKLKPW
jgi:hypothetical protein